MNRFMPGILAMAAIVLASNILVQFPLGAFLTWGALTYPFAFLVTDLTNRLHGAGAARRVVLWGFATGIVCSLIGTQISGEFGPLVTLRIALGSGLAFLLAQMTDVGVFSMFRRDQWWKAPLISTLVSSTLDTVIFFSIAFAAMFTFVEPGNDVSWAAEPTPLLGLGPLFPFWVSLAIGDWCVKIALALVALVPFRIIVGKLTARVA
jgi:hypothetical protein